MSNKRKKSKNKKKLQIKTIFNDFSFLFLICVFNILYLIFYILSNYQNVTLRLF